MAKVISDNTILKVTGLSWIKWTERMGMMGAPKLSHQEIVRLLIATYNVDDWWAQTLTVRYNRANDHKALGQGGDGFYTAAITEDYSGTIDQALDWWQTKINRSTMFGHDDIETSSTTQTGKWRYYRAVLTDKSRVLVGIYQKTPSKAEIGLIHERLATEEIAAGQQLFWKSFFSNS